MSRDSFICVKNKETGKVQKVDIGPGMELIKNGSCEEIDLDTYHEIRNNEPETFRIGDNVKRIFAGVDPDVFEVFKRRANKEVKNKGKYHSSIEAAMVYLIEGWAAGLDLARPKQETKETGVDYRKEHK